MLINVQLNEFHRPFSEYFGLKFNSILLSFEHLQALYADFFQALWEPSASHLWTIMGGSQSI